MHSIFNQIIDHYPEYISLVKGKKLAKRKYFQLVSGRVSKNDWYLGQLMLAHDGGSECQLDTEKSKKINEKYRFILFDKSFAREPICRFDSTGKAHTNANPKIPLNERTVEAPHFHFFDSDGYGFAYQTRNLIASVTSLQKNIKVGWQLMCDEYSIFTDDGLVPEILEIGEIFPKPKMQFDVHADVLFIP